MNIKALNIIVTLTLICFSTVLPGVSADDFEAAEEEETSTNTFILDANDSGGDIQLQFGTTLNEFLQWNDTQQYFEISDDLIVDGNVNTFGSVLRLDFDETGNPDRDIEIFASQGSESPGVIRYDDGNNRWEFSNDGISFTPFGSGASGTGVFFDAFDSSGNTNISSGFTDIPLNTQRQITPSFSHTLGSSVVTINETATYVVSFTVTTDISTGTARSQSEMRLMLNSGSGFSLVPGSIGRMYNRDSSQGETTATRTLLLDFTAGDQIKIQAARVSGSDTIVTLANGSSLSIFKPSGVGPTGPQGPQGPSGSNGAGWVENGANTETLLNALISGSLTVNQSSQFNEDQNSRCGDHAVFWAERGGVSSNTSWAMGNGQTPFGSPMGCPGRVRRFAATCTGSIGSSLGAQIRVNNTPVACSVSVPNSIGGVAVTDCDIPFSGTDVVGVYAQTEVGSWTECVGTFWVRYD